VIKKPSHRLGYQEKRRYQKKKETRGTGRQKRNEDFKAKKKVNEEPEKAGKKWKQVSRADFLTGEKLKGHGRKESQG